MIGSLSDFYKSKEWQDLLKILKLSRLNEEGNIICECCGKPIVKKYDCIGHHIIELTMANVYNADISLNPANIQLVHHACHNKIHHRLGRIERAVWLVYGAPLSGKTKYVADVRQDGDLIVDIDSIWQAVSGCERYVKPKRLNGVVFNLRDTLVEAVKHRLGKWENAYIIGGYPIFNERKRLIESLGAREIFIDTSKEVCLARLDLCNDGRNKNDWKKYINDWFFAYTPPYSENI